jgi:hypothetical protein
MVCVGFAKSIFGLCSRKLSPSLRVYTVSYHVNKIDDLVVKKLVLSPDVTVYEPFCVLEKR